VARTTSDKPNRASHPPPYRLAAKEVDVCSTSDIHPAFGHYNPLSCRAPTPDCCGARRSVI
jgi:hypothetical protein